MESKGAENFKKEEVVVTSNDTEKCRKRTEVTLTKQFSQVIGQRKRGQ